MRQVGVEARFWRRVQEAPASHCAATPPRHAASHSAPDATIDLHARSRFSLFSGVPRDVRVEPTFGGPATAAAVAVAAPAARAVDIGIAAATPSPVRRPRRRTAGIGRRSLPLVAALTGALLFVAFTDSGRLSRDADAMQTKLDRVLEKLGLALEQVSLTGHRMTADSDVFAALALETGRTLARFDSAAARARIEALPWVKSVTITRVLPAQLDVRITERRPLAVWRQAGADVLIDATGRRLASAAAGTVGGLPVVSGDGADGAAVEILTLIEALPDLTGRVERAERVGGRRWTLHLKDGLRVHLPSVAEASALQALVEGAVGRRLIDLAAEEIDMRAPGQVTVRPLQVRRSVASASQARS